MINLNNITLISICDSNYLDKTIKAIDISRKNINFFDTIILTNTNKKLNDIKTKTINLKLDTINYSILCINYLKDFVDSEFCLIIQWDGFVINEKLWKDDFMSYDYIGAPWGFPEDCRNRVGNGGFSLRSKKFLEVSSKIKYKAYDYDVYTDLQKIDRPVAPEDWFLCYHSYDKMKKENIKFADIDTAYSFSVEHPSHIKQYNRENLNTYKSFGFHGSFNTAAMNLLKND